MFDRVDSLILVYLRVVVGVAIYCWAIDFLANDKYDVIFVQPRFLFKYAGFEWMRLWSGEGIYWHFVVLRIASVCLVVGFLTRFSAAIACFAITYVLLVQRQFYSDYDYLLLCLAGLLVFLPASRRLSVDTLIGIERDESTFARWQLWLLRFQLGIPFIFAAFAKLDGDWLRGQPVDLVLRSRTDLPLLDSISQLPGAALTIAYGAFLFDLLVVPMLLYRRTRWFAVLLSVCFHLSIGLLLPSGAYPWFMLAMIVLFFPTQTLPHRLRLFLGQPAIDRIPGLESTTTTESLPITRYVRAGIVLAAVFVVIQIVLPIRPWIYPGNASWNERGRHLAWRMMLRDKRALTHFLLVDENTGEYIFVPSTIILTPTQASIADHHPELVRQTSLQLKELVAKEFGVADCRIYALALVSLNGRRPTPIVHPAVDLPNVQHSGWRDDWVAADPGPFLDPPWNHETAQWWTQLDLSERFKPLQGHTPAELLEFLEQRKRRIEEN